MKVQNVHSKYNVKILRTYFTQKCTRNFGIVSDTSPYVSEFGEKNEGVNNLDLNSTKFYAYSSTELNYIFLVQDKIVF